MVLLKNALTTKLKKSKKTKEAKGDPYLIFELGKRAYAVPLDTVYRFEERTSIAKVPSSLEFFQGVVTYLDDFVGVLNLKKALKIDKGADSGDVLILFKNQSTFLAAVVDDIKDIRYIPNGSIKKEVPIETENNEIFHGFSRIGKEIVTHLDIKSWIGRPDISKILKVISEHINTYKKNNDKIA